MSTSTLLIVGTDYFYSRLLVLFLVLIHVYLRRIQHLRLYLQLYYYAKYTGTFTLVLLYVCLCVCVPYLPVAYMTRNIRAGYSYIRKQVINYYWRQLKFKRSPANFHTTFCLAYL